MGYIKLNKAPKADGTAQFDIISCEGVGDVKIHGDAAGIDVSYLSQCKVAIAAGGTDTFTDDDVQLIVDKIQKFAGTSGPAPLVKLSKNIASTTMTVLAQANS